ncbi:LuxR C-terminal-related transcriptional regulator [Nocardioides sp. LHG3406-4]|uniref:LuxR C-terminal-related transcriptional regulator n=1 Tax=Nocardioides sp. LHG3406-4 TaxID=2804575 RepID=UPI003CECB468
MLTACVGRERVRELLDTALSSSRWVSIVGPPGCGKTLLARHATAHTRDTAWVNARGLNHTDAVLAACLDALDVEPVPGDSPEGALSRALDGTETLLVVDGVDIDAAGSNTLGATFQQVLDATSTARLALTALTMAGQPAERVVRVGPLPLPGIHEPLAGPVVDLLRSRVEGAGGHPIDLVAHDRDVRRLLAATGGLPLLIEQFAVQIALMGITNVVPAASLSEAVHASYELLDDDQQRCFRRMAQMTSPVSIDVLAEIAEVSRETATSLAARLVRRSLLEVLPDGRFDMLSPIRRHGTFLAASTDDAAQVHAGLLRWADRVAPDHDNFGAADAPWLADLPVMRTAILGACADPATRDTGYALANRVFSSLYTSMRAREAVEILEAAIVSGDGPAAIGAQVARRAGIAASEVRGTYEGLWLLDRADEHALNAPDTDLQLARNASIRAEMHLDAGDLTRAEKEAQRAIDLDTVSRSIVRQATRTLTDIAVSRGNFAAATRAAASIMASTEANDERWITLSARILLGKVALEQGRTVEAASAARAVMREARQLAEDRVALLAETLLRGVDRDYVPMDVDREMLPWAVRLPVLAQDARDLFAAGEVQRAAGLAADVVVLADSSRLGRDGVEVRLLLGRAFLALGDLDQAATTLLYALEQATTMPMPLRVADALDGLGCVADQREQPESRLLAAAATALRTPRHAVPWGYAAEFPVAAARTAPDGWVDGGEFTERGLLSVAAVFTGAPEPETVRHSPLALLTRAERQVADKIADGLTSRQIADELYISPRTVDAHLSHIYRKLDINTRARLAAMVADDRTG